MTIRRPTEAPPWLLPYTSDVEAAIEAARQIPQFTVATVPSAARFPYRWIHVTDEAGGSVPAFSDGADWRRCTDRAIIS